ncbi:MAG: ribose-phosphate pyrophosphokinase [Planctomycetales bacterium 4484_113]|nr:MAG: ribose-phosphate pyrophosphokinase [Planctomycetales bacterium 4484_113]
MSVELQFIKKLTLVSGNANRQLAEDIAEHLGIPLTQMAVSRFADGETRVKIDESIRGQDVFVVQPTSPPANEHLMELLIIIDALRRASAHRIAAVIPYYGYARQDKKVKPREPITARLVANLLEVAGAQRVLAMDLHSGPLQGFFNIPVDNLSALLLFVQHIKEHGFTPEKTVVVSPDVGGVARASEVASRVGFALAIIAKRRPEPNVAEAIELIGDVEGRTCILYDDIVDTGGSVVNGAKLLERRGAGRILVYATHGILSGDALQRIEQSPIEKVVITDTIAFPPEKQNGKVEIVSTALTFAEAIRRGFADESISTLFK